MSIRKGNDIIAGTLNTSTYYTKSDIDSLSNDLVHKSGTETISGVKTITNEPVITAGNVNVKHTDVTKGTIVSANKYWGIEATANPATSTDTSWQGRRMGKLEWCLNTSNVMSATLSAYRNEEASTTSTAIGVYYDTANSTGWTSAPTPGSLDNSTKIATTKWIFDNVLKIIFPDYTRKASMTSPYTAPCYGFAMWNNSGTGAAKVNGQTIAVAGNDSYNEGPAFVPLKKGDILTFTPDTGLCEFYPCSGN